MAKTKKLVKSSEAVFDGVCGGFAEYFDVDPLFVRIAWALLFFFTSLPMGIIYIICMFCMPD